MCVLQIRENSLPYNALADVVRVEVTWNTEDHILVTNYKAGASCNLRNRSAKLRCDYVYVSEAERQLLHS